MISYKLYGERPLNGFRPRLKNAIIRLSANSIEYQMVSVKLSAIYPSIIRHFYLLRR